MKPFFLIIGLVAGFIYSRAAFSQTPSAANIVWQNSVGLAIDGSLITKTATGTQWGNAGANTLNILKNTESGGIQYKLRDATTSFAIGLDAVDTSGTRHSSDIKRGFLFDNGSLSIFSNGTVLATIGTAKANDKLTMVKNAATYEYLVNDILKYTESRTDTNTLRMELAMKTNGTTLQDLQLSFYARIQASAFKLDGVDYDQNTGFIELHTKYGLPPYRYTWNTGAHSNVIYDLTPGNYSVSITDSLYEDTVKLSFIIAQKTNWVDVENIIFGENTLSKIDPLLPASATTSGYIADGRPGWYEVLLLDKAHDFEFTLQEFVLPEKRINYRHGVELADGKLYAIYNNERVSTLEFRVGDRIRIGRLEEEFYIIIRGEKAYQAIIHPAFNLTGRIRLTGTSVNLGGPLALVNRPLDGIFDDCPDSKNWTKETIYDGSGNVVSVSKNYFDNMGRSTQSLVRNVSANNVIATQFVYDAYGRGVLQTLPAPVFGTELCYRHDFFVLGDKGEEFSYRHFDKPDDTGAPGEQSNPMTPSQAVMGSLGWYYSDNNTIEPFVAAAQNPYNRIEYNSLNTTDIKKASKAGHYLGHGSGHEVYTFTMPTAGELNYMFGYGGSWTMNDLTMAFTGNDYTGQVNTAFYPNAGEVAMKEITRDENGVEMVVFRDVKGNVIGSCLAGKQDGVNVKVQYVQGVIKPLDEARRFMDIHLPDGCETSLKLYQNAGSNYVYNIYELKTGKTIQFSGSENYTGTSPNLEPGFYRIYLKSCPYTALSSIPVRQQLNYYNFTLNYYDKANRLKVTVPPNGYDSTYVFSPQIVNTGTRTHFNALSNNKVYTGNLATVDWSMSSSGFSNEVSLSLPAPTPLQLSNVITSITYRKDWKVVEPVPGGYNPTQRSSGDFYAAANFAEPSVALDTIDFNPPITAYDSTGAAYYIIPPVGGGSGGGGSGGGGSSNPCNIVLAVPFRFWYQLQDQNGVLLRDVYNNPATYVDVATCYLHSCQNGTSFRTWDLPSPKQFYLSPAQSATITTLKMKISNVIAYTGQAFNSSILYDLEATIGVNTHQLPGLPQHSMQEINKYNSWSQLLTSYKPDVGQADYIYSMDGKSRFSQNSKQDASHNKEELRNFSYVNYDEYDRPVEKGQFVPNATYTGSAPANSYFENYAENLFNSNPADPASVINKTEIALEDHFRTHERVAISYDLPDPDFYTLTGLSPADYKQEYVTGDVSYSYNEQKRTWYSYDELGRTVWMVQRYENTGGQGSWSVKTFNYKYDFLGNVTEIAYQKENSTESFYHYYVYDADKRLKKVYTGRDGLNRKQEAAYYYYLHGPLKRVELANRLQGIDYVYTINGWLKNMNAPEMDDLRDPGKDGQMNGLYQVPKDLFGMSLDYFEGDYEKAGTYVQTYPEAQNSNPSVAPDLFNGIIKAQRWRTQTPAFNLVYQDQHLFYGYKYDKKYQLKEANFGVWDSDGSQNYPLGEGLSKPINVTLSNDYKVHNLSYDYNGNIKSLSRNAYASGAGGIDLDQLSYSYIANGNKLEKVTDAVPTNPYTNLGYNPGQTNNNFQYNALGELMSDINDNKTYEYNHFGQITRVSDLASNPIVEYDYDESGQRVCKRAFVAGNTITTLYVRAGNGQVMAIYEKTSATPTYGIKEWNIYGADRIATAFETGAQQPEYVYEINDHLGNTRTTFRANSLWAVTTSYDGGDAYDYFVKDPLNTLDPARDVSGGVGKSVEVFYPSKTIGAGFYKMPVKYGQTIEVYASSLYTSSTYPNASLLLKLVDENGNLLAGQNTAMAPIPVGSGWKNTNLTFVVNENYPEMFVEVYPYNPDPSGIHAWFDELTLEVHGPVPSCIEIPEQLNVASYYPHGSVMPGLNFSSTLGGRYGYQGQYAEQDKEINESFFELRNYNPLTARFNTTDPKEQNFSPYLAMGNSPVNQIDPDGGFSGSWVGAAVGAGIGLGVAAYLDYKDNGKFNLKDNWWKYAAWGGGGFVAGGIAGGLIQNGGKLNGAEFWGYELTKRRYTSSSRLFKWSIEKPNHLQLNTKLHFSFGFRVANWVLLDVRFNAKGGNNFQKNFPGRWNINPGATFRLSLFYFVCRKNSGHYNMMTTRPWHDPNCFYGGYTKFHEHLGSNNSTHMK